jgi:hypothetical protein
MELLGANVNKVQREQEYVIGHGDTLSVGLYEEGNNTKLFKGNTLKFDYTHFVAGKAVDQNIFVRSGDIIILD